MNPQPLFESFDWSEYERVVVLSPHLDDAALSCFGLLDRLNGVVSRLVITICCGNPAPAPGFGDVDEFRDDSDLSKYGSPDERRLEDVAAMEALDCDFVHLGFEDGVYRRSPTSGEYIYRTTREKFVRPRIEDASHIEELFLVLRRLCQNMGRLLLVSPMSIGYHVDHSITAHNALRLEDSDVELLFYEDFPYVLHPRYSNGVEDSPMKALERIGRAPLRRYAVGFDPAKKEEVIGHYTSQIPVLFEDYDDLRESLARRTHDGAPSEFYWSTRTQSDEDD